MSQETIRAATKQDAEALRAIYAPYVNGTAVTFEWEVPTREEFARRIERVLERYPYLVAERDGAVVGYAYASTYNSRTAYSWTAESTVYVREDLRNTGVGGRLYEALGQILAMQNIVNVIARVACPEVEDEYLTRNSVQFHQHMGYRLVGEFSKCGYKFGRWYNMTWMEKHLGEHPDDPHPVKTFAQVRKKVAKELEIV